LVDDNDDILAEFKEVSECRGFEVVTVVFDVTQVIACCVLTSPWRLEIA
jgi:hypothetical protein